MAGCLSLEAALLGAHVAWVAPTYGNSRALWRFLERAGLQDKRIVTRKSERELVIPRAGRIGIYTADNSVGMRGEAFDIVICDEAPQYHEEVWSDVLMPTLADRSGRAFLIGTPKGRNWFWREYQRGLADGTHYASFTAPSSANPLPSIRRAAELARQYVSDRTYRQEWLAEFVEDGGGVFRRVAEAATLAPMDRGEDGRYYVIGADWGRTNDATVFAVMDVERRAVVALDRMTNTDYNLQLARLRALSERFGNARVLAELNSMGGPQVERAQAEGVNITGFTTTNTSKAAMIDALALAFERGELSMVADAVAVGELQAYESERLPGGTLRYSAPQGMHDDCVVAIGLSLWAARGSGVGAVEV